ncbi:MAG: M24 family metallopeptidase, partial [Vicinamibacteria bacterium]
MIRRRDDRELDKMHQANAIVLSTLDVLRAKIEPGITTAELDRIAAREIAREGARPAFKGYRGFPASMCVSVNDEVV